MPTADTETVAVLTLDPLDDDGRALVQIITEDRLDEHLVHAHELAAFDVPLPVPLPDHHLDRDDVILQAATDALTARGWITSGVWLETPEDQPHRTARARLTHQTRT